jgi:enterochelin esterase-like enzyme
MNFLTGGDVWRVLGVSTCVFWLGCASAVTPKPKQAAPKQIAQKQAAPAQRHRQKSTGGLAGWTDPERKTFPGATYETFHSNTVSTDVCYLIYLPPNYKKEKNKRYPVLYALHGGQSEPSVSGARVVPRLDKAIRAGQIPPMIIVMPNGLGGKTMWSDTRDGKLPVESVLVKDLIPHIDATYRTIPSREGRALNGFSMGGYGAGHLGFKYPEVFGVVSMQAPALLQPDVKSLTSHFNQHFKFAMGSDMDYFLSNEPFTLIEKNADKLRDRTFIRITCHGGTGWLISQCDKMHELFIKLSIAHQFAYQPNVKGHWEGKLAEAMGESGDAFYASGFKYLQDAANPQKPSGSAEEEQE